MFLKSLEYLPGVFMMKGDVIFGVDPQVIHVDLYPFLLQHVHKNIIHECLKCRGGIAKSKEHDCGFKESHGGNESGFPLILLLDADIIVFPANVKFGEQGGLLHVVDEFQNEGEGVGISDSVRV